MTDKERLLRDFDEGHFITMKALADLAEESDDKMLAVAWRWLEKYRKLPMTNIKTFTWTRLRARRGQPSYLEPGIIDLMKDKYGNKCRSFRTRSAALDAAALAVKAHFIRAEENKKKTFP